MIRLKDGKEYIFIWCGMKRRRDSGVGFLIKKDPNIIISYPDDNTPRVIAMNIIVYGFKLRVVNVYSPMNIDDSEQNKE